MTLILLRPKSIALRNSIILNLRSPQQVFRTALLTFFALFVCWSIYYGTCLMITKINELATIAYIPPEIPMGLLFMFIMAMLSLSGVVSAMGALFHSRDLDLILASPLSPFKFYSGKLIEVIISSSWLVIVFGVPALLAFGSAYHAGWFYYSMIIITILPYFLIPAALSLILATLFATLIPISRTREAMGVITVLSFFGLAFLFRLLIPSTSSLQDVTTMLKIVSYLLIPNGTWSPSYWSASILSIALGQAPTLNLNELLLLYSVTAALSSFCYIIIRTCHFSAYSKARVQKLNTRSVTTSLPSIFKLLPVSKPTQAIISKEFRIFSRDMTQALQLIMLLGVCVIYLYNLRVLNTIENLSEESKLWWQGFLSVTNVCLGAFVVSAMCTRLVFPSISLEGQSFWILQTSPLSSYQILRSKFYAWLIPVSLVGSVTFAAGALAINSDPLVVALNIIVSWVMSAGIVGLAVGLGAYFVNFDWEHPSQLIASFGSLVFMLLSIMLILLNLIPPCLVVFLRSQRYFDGGLNDFQWYTSLLCTGALLVYLNYATVRWALGVGNNALLRRR